MGTLNIPQPNIPARNSAGSQLATSALEMLFKRYLDKRDAAAAEKGANQYLNMKEGLPEETEYKSFAPMLESMVGSGSAEPPKKEAPGFPTPPAPATSEAPQSGPFPELSKMTGLEDEATPKMDVEPENVSLPPTPPPAYAKMPPQQAVARPKQQVATGQPTSHYGARILQDDAQASQTATSYDPVTGAMTLVPKAAGAQLGIKPQREGLQKVETDKGIFFAPKKQGIVIDPNTGEQALSRNMRMEGIQESQKGSFVTQYDPELGRSRPFSKWELRKKLEDSGASAMPATPGEAKMIYTVAGRVPAVFNAAENARQAAQVAIQKHGKLNWRDDEVAGTGASLGQIAALVQRLTHSNDVVDSNLITTYMHSLVNYAMDPETRNYANHLLTLYEAAVGANSLIGGSNQTSDLRYRALLAALPGPSDMYMNDIDGKINRFQTDVALSVSNLPNIKGPHGYTIQDINRDLREIHDGKPYAESLIAKLAGSAGTTVAPPPAAPQGGVGQLPTSPVQQAPVRSGPAPAARPQAAPTEQVIEWVRGADGRLVRKVR